MTTASAAKTAAKTARLIQISVQDIRLTMGNQLARRIDASPGITADGDGIRIVPQQYFPAQTWATMTIDSATMIRLLRQSVLSIICESDSESTNLAEICQRVPSRQRRNQIREAWADKHRTPEGKVETVPMAVFAGKLNIDGLVLNDNTLCVLTDAAGRLSAACDEINETNGSVLLERKILWQLNIDLSGNFSKQLMHFLSTNRDAKKINKGTTVCVEAALLTQLSINGERPVMRSLGDKLAQTFVLQRLLADYPIDGSLAELYRWKYEGHSSTNAKFLGNGSASTIVTAIGEHAALLDRCGYTPENLPDVLDFSFRIWHHNCPRAVEDAHNHRKGKKSAYRLHSTLALKVIIMLSARAYRISGPNEVEFVELINKILKKHYSHQKTNSYVNTKLHYVTMDRFFQNCKYMCESDKFNSGAVNTQNLMRDLGASCDDVCGSVSGLKD